MHHKEEAAAEQRKEDWNRRLQGELWAVISRIRGHDHIRSSRSSPRRGGACESTTLVGDAANDPRFDLYSAQVSLFSPHESAGDVRAAPPKSTRPTPGALHLQTIWRAAELIANHLSRHFFSRLINGDVKRVFSRPFFSFFPSLPRSSGNRIPCGASHFSFFSAFRVSVRAETIHRFLSILHVGATTIKPQLACHLLSITLRSLRDDARGPRVIWYSSRISCSKSL